MGEHKAKISLSGPFHFRSPGTRLLPFAAVFLDMCIQSLAGLQERITRVFCPLIGVLKLFGLRVLQVPGAFDINSSVRL